MVIASLWNELDKLFEMRPDRPTFESVVRSLRVGHVRPSPMRRYTCNPSVFS
jgi:hypothetical protein